MIEQETGKGYGDPLGDIAEFQLMELDDKGEPDEMIAATSGPRADALTDILRYVPQGVACALFEVVRVRVDLSLLGAGHA